MITQTEEKSIAIGDMVWHKAESKGRGGRYDGCLSKNSISVSIKNRANREKGIEIRIPPYISQTAGLKIYDRVDIYFNKIACKIVRNPQGQYTMTGSRGKEDAKRPASEVRLRVSVSNSSIVDAAFPFTLKDDLTRYCSSQHEIKQNEIVFVFKPKN